MSVLDARKGDWASLVRAVHLFFDEIGGKYDTSKYDPDSLEEFKLAFSDLSTVEPDTLDRAIRWKYGKLSRGRVTDSQAAVIKTIQTRWAEFSGSAPSTPSAVFEFWDRHLNSTAFITKAFLVHLSFPDTVPIIDQHNWRAMRHLAARFECSDLLPQHPRRFEHVLLLGRFMRLVLACWDETLGSPPSMGALDRYLMMFGKHVAPR